MGPDVVKRDVKVGDIIIIPAGVPHGWTKIPDHVDYLSFRPHPDRVLEAVRAPGGCKEVGPPGTTSAAPRCFFHDATLRRLQLPRIDQPPSGVVPEASAVLFLVSTPRVRALTPLLASTRRRRRLHTLLLLLVVTLGAGGSGLGARTTEIAEAESESQVRLEATHARRRGVHLELVPQGIVGEPEASDVESARDRRAGRVEIRPTRRAPSTSSSARPARPGLRPRSA